MGTSKKQKKREWLRYRDFVLSPYGVIKIKSLGYIAQAIKGHSLINSVTSLMLLIYLINLKMQV
ncbi:hypothetical protein [Symbiopectobacterium sp. RP]|uniref:hypothetical protein n=1 Tax=Symbiopectobacterium sp. RP TaxID=3248553 RepID=UPI003D26DEF6